MTKSIKKKNKPTISFDDVYSFNKACDKKDKVLSIPITEYIIKNYNSKKPNHKIITVEIKNTSQKFNICLDKEKFKSTLEDFLELFLKEEQYELCTKISKIINNE